MGNIVFRMAHTYSLCVIFLNFHGFIFGMWSFSLSRVMTLILERNTHEIKRATIAATSFFASCIWWKTMNDVYTVCIYIYIRTYTRIRIHVSFFHLYIWTQYCIDTNVFIPHEAGDLEVILVFNAIGCARARRILAFRKTWTSLRNLTSQVWEMVMDRS